MRKRRIINFVLGLIIVPFFLAFISKRSRVAIINETTQSTPKVDTMSGEDVLWYYCSMCHLLDDELLGPPLRKVYLKREQEWLSSFIRNGMQLVAEGDSTAVALYEHYKIAHPPHPLCVVFRQDH